MSDKTSKEYIVANIEIIKENMLQNGGGTKERNLHKFKNKIFTDDMSNNFKYHQETMSKVTLSDFIDIFKELGELEIITANFEKGIKADLYIFFPKEHNIYTISRLLQPNAYFSNFTALSLHQLIQDKSNIIHLKNENRLPEKERNIDISQKQIDIAFSKPARKSSKIAKIKWKDNEYKILISNGYKLLENRHLTTIEMNNNFEPLLVSNIERTLVDCVIRPDYSGGIHSIFDAFVEAKTILSIKNIKKVLVGYNLSYPYEKNIALFMKKAMFPRNNIEMIIKNNINVNYVFYLDYQIISKKLDNEVNIYYPSWMDEMTE